MKSVSYDVGYPIYSVASHTDDLGRTKVVVSGGGGAAKTGVKNAMTILESRHNAAKLQKVVQASFNEDAVMSVDIDEEGQHLAAACNAPKLDANLHIFELRDPNKKNSSLLPITSLKSLIGEIQACGEHYQRITYYSKTFLVSGTTFGQVCVFAVKNHMLRIFEAALDGEVYDLDVSPDNRWLLVTTAESVNVYALLIGERQKNPDPVVTVKSPRYSKNKSDATFRCAKFITETSILVVSNVHKSKAFLSIFQLRISKPRKQNQPGPTGNATQVNVAISKRRTRTIGNKTASTMALSADRKYFAIGDSGSTVSTGSLRVSGSIAYDFAIEKRFRQTHGMPATGLAIVRYRNSDVQVFSASVDGVVKVHRWRPASASFFGALARLAFTAILILFGLSWIYDRSPGDHLPSEWQPTYVKYRDWAGSTVSDAVESNDSVREAYKQAAPYIQQAAPILEQAKWAARIVLDTTRDQVVIPAYVEGDRIARQYYQQWKENQVAEDPTEAADTSTPATERPNSKHSFAKKSRDESNKAGHANKINGEKENEQIFHAQPVGEPEHNVEDDGWTLVTSEQSQEAPQPKSPPSQGSSFDTNHQSEQPQSKIENVASDAMEEDSKTVEKERQQSDETEESRGKQMMNEAAERKEDEARAKAAQEAKMAAIKAEEERKRQAEQKALEEAEKRKQAAKEAQMAASKAEEDRKRREEEKAAEKRKQDEQAAKEAEQRRRRELAAQAAEEKRQQDLKVKAAEEERIRQQERRVAEEEKKRQEEVKAAEEQKRRQDEAKAAEEERRRQEEAKAAEELRQRKLAEKAAEEERQRQMAAENERQRQLAEQEAAVRKAEEEQKRQQDLAEKEKQKRAEGERQKAPPAAEDERRSNETRKGYTHEASGNMQPESGKSQTDEKRMPQEKQTHGSDAKQTTQPMEKIRDDL